MRSFAKEIKRVIVKIGTNAISRENGQLDLTQISHIVDQIAGLKQQGIEVILVSSGAVGAGRVMVNLSKSLGDIAKRQVFSAVGQITLMNKYLNFFQSHQLFCAQVLVTKEDFRDRTHYLNMKSCLNALLADNIVPIINENDVISISELMFTDNDELAGLLASMIKADALLIMSNVAGVLNGHPNDEKSQVITSIKADDKSVVALISPNRSSFGRGGMYTKIKFAQKAAAVGIETFIVNGKRKNVIVDVLEGQKIGTYFKAEKNISSIKKWIAYQEGEKKAIIYINKGAVAVLSSTEKVSSLLPIGITKIVGVFEKGDIVQIVNEEESFVGIGIAKYDSQKAQSVVGQKGAKALVHYDYLFIK